MHEIKSNKMDDRAKKMWFLRKNRMDSWACVAMLRWFLRIFSNFATVGGNRICDNQ
jgi:hypothetical protein